MKKKAETHTAAGTRMIEADAFPFEFLSSIAERESWRKEIYRPTSYIHKWWAKRLGSVFRGMILGSLLDAGGDLCSAFYLPHKFSGTTVFDPFMGSGTTVAEAHKLGCTALGRDINSVACRSVRAAMGPLDRQLLETAFLHLARTTGDRIRRLYQSEDSNGALCDTLYFFWVKQARCPDCGEAVDLLSSRIIARNAYPDKKPEIQVLCPACGDIFQALNGGAEVRCRCGHRFNPHQGTAQGAKAECPSCCSEFSILDAVRAQCTPPRHRLYGKLLLTADGGKVYLPTSERDIRSYDHCSALLRDELRHGTIRLPEGTLEPGYNTRQAIGYNYRQWRDFFNDRQLLALGWLQKGISESPNPAAREALHVLFSGVLEFNNMFASYKGEGTGAVRHMFSHHILKPERTPIEANVWGTPKSSGSFSGLFKSRLLRAIEYRDAPFEPSLGAVAKVYGASPAFSGSVNSQWPTSGHFETRAVYLSCGSSDKTGLPDASIDLIATDPPFFDNVHYSELADFFHAWQRLYPSCAAETAETTRNPREVQDTDAKRFSRKLNAVLVECHRVLRDKGILTFTYHHSRAEGWAAVASAVVDAGFSVVNAHPVKAELSVAAPKAQAKEPIQLDIILVCRKRARDTRSCVEPNEALCDALAKARAKAARLLSIGLKLSQNDFRVIVISQFISCLGPTSSAASIVQALDDCQSELERATVALAQSQSLHGRRRPSRPMQMALAFATG